MPSVQFHRRCSIGLPLRLILCACSVALTAVPRASAQQDEPLVEILAQMLASEDARDYQAVLFTEAARHESPLVRRRAALSLGRIGHPGAVGTLLDLVSDADESVAVAAAFALGLLRDSTAIPRLEDMVLRSRAPEQRAVESEAVAAIARIGGEEAHQVFAEILGRGISRIGAGDLAPVTLRGLEEFWRLGPGAPADVIAAYAASPNADVRWRVVYGLSRLKVPETAGVLLAATADSVARVRAAAVRALTASYGDAAGGRAQVFLARVRLLTADPDPLVRIQALRALGTYVGRAGIGSVADRLNDVNPNVRVAAVTALASLQDSAAASELAAWARQGPWASRRPALRGLAGVDAARALPGISELMMSDEWFPRFVAAEALGQMPADHARRRLSGLVRDADPRVAGAALDALIQVDPEEGRRQAVASLQHADPVVRLVAELHVGDVGGIADVDLLVDAFARAEEDEWHGARVGALEALATLAANQAAERGVIEARLVARVSSAPDHLARRTAERHLPGVAEEWGPSTPLTTGRGPGDYRDIVRRILLPAARGRKPSLVLETDRGQLTVELQAQDAPLTVDAFLRLATRRFFDGQTWHRVVPGFVIQAGDPRGDGWGGPGFTLRDELSPWPYRRGTVGLALTGPDTGGSQFFVTLKREPHLDGAYPILGTIQTGEELLDIIAEREGIRRVAVPFRSPRAAN